MKLNEIKQIIIQHLKEDFEFYEHSPAPILRV